MQRLSRCDPIQMNPWKIGRLDGASELGIRGKNPQDNGDGEAEAALFQQIGRPQMALGRLQKISAALLSFNSVIWS
jgi:hypothetical protein